MTLFTKCLLGLGVEGAGKDSKGLGFVVAILSKGKRQAIKAPLPLESLP